MIRLFYLTKGKIEEREREKKMKGREVWRIKLTHGICQLYDLMHQGSVNPRRISIYKINIE